MVFYCSQTASDSEEATEDLEQTVIDIRGKLEQETDEPRERLRQARVNDDPMARVAPGSSSGSVACSFSLTSTE